MKTIKPFLPWSIRFLVSFLFLLSAVAKLYPSPYFAISTFEVKQLYPLGFSENVAPYFSRVLIGIEFALGILLLQAHFLKKIVIPATIAMLVVFTTHLSIETFMNGGNSGNCGCFGSLLPMTPIEAIIKNVIALGMLIYLLILLPKNEKDKTNFWILSTVTFSTILALFMMAPIQPVANNFIVTPVVETIQDTTTFEQDSDTTILKEPSVLNVSKKDTLKQAVIENNSEPKKVKSGYANFFPKIDNQKKILCFFVPGCDHCREAAKELTEMRKKQPDFPSVSILFMNEEAELIPSFFKDAGAEYPYKIIEIIPFWNLLGSGKDTPGVKYLWNGNVIKYYFGITEDKFTGSDLDMLLHKSYTELKKSNPKL